MNISIASDHAGFEQKQALAAYLRDQGHEVIDRGPGNDDRVDYPDFAELVARGHDVGSVKHHSHVGFDIDYPGKDSYRHPRRERH